MENLRQQAEQFSFEVNGKTFEIDIRHSSRVEGGGFVTIASNCRPIAIREIAYCGAEKEIGIFLGYQTPDELERIGNALINAATFARKRLSKENL